MAGTNERIVVIGAGAAGIAAARTLHDAGRDVLLMDARDRIGGRAESFALPGGGMLDRGCSWLHSARRNPWTDVARARGLTIETHTANWGEQWRDLGFLPDDQRAFAAAQRRMDAAAHAALVGADRPLAAFVAPDDPWRPLLEAISGYANGAGLADVSLHDWARYEDAATADNWAVREGYGTLIVGHAAGVPRRLSTPVTRIDHRARVLRLESPAGTIEATRVIVTVPTTALADDGGVVFDPPLPAKRDAAAALPLGVADKAFLAVEGAIDWPDDAHLIGDPRRAETASYRLSPFGLPVIEAYFGGDFAIEMEGEAACAFAIEELTALLGSDWRRRLSPLGATCWHRTPHIRGSYSHARVGHAGARAILAAPVDDRLFFAGEACSPTDFSTAHGAYATGVAAARAILAS